MNYRQKQDVMVKLAQVRLAINHVIRNRALQKSAGTRTWTTSDGSLATKTSTGNIWNLWNYPKNVYRYYTGQGLELPTVSISDPKSPTLGINTRNKSMYQQSMDPKLRKNPKDNYGGM